ncbi:MAG: restriction endonuclease [Minisyncoccia bacterium]|jgi:HJR/Mrr/RecB family endonuclease
MAKRHRRYYRKSDSLEDIVERLLTLILVIGFLYLFGLWFTDRAGFWRIMIYMVVAIVVIAALVIFLKIARRQKAGRHFEWVLENLKKSGREDYLKNFISRWGLEKASADRYHVRNHYFDWDRINDLKKILGEAGVTSDDRDVFDLLQYYVQGKEESLTRESIKKEPQRFAYLSGTDFEKLLYRLFEAMGYKVEHIGRSGDQGGDLIANREGERILIQAKCYRDWSVGNEAVQQVVGAMKFYDCSKTMVITTSMTFTPEAHALAQANNTDLISKDELCGMLLKYLGESWG